MIERKHIYINGKWVNSSVDGSIAVTNPTTEELFASVPRGSVDDVGKAAEAAADAFASWSQSSLRERIEVIHGLARIIDARADEITQTIVSEVGQPISVATQNQTRGAIDDLNVIAEALREITWVEEIGNAQVRRQPTGVVGAITPWNTPLRAIITKAVAAIAAGCTVVLKGSEVAPLSSFIFAEIAEEAGLPEGVLNLVCGTGPVIGEAIAIHPLVDAVSITGSVRAGRRVMELASHGIKRVHLELGGKSANIILDDAVFERAIADGIDDAFRNAGQVCGGLSRILVPRERLRKAEELAVRKAESYVLGDPLGTSTTMGPVTTSKQRERVRGYIQSGVAEGARLLAGGAEAPAEFRRGYFVRPTVFSGDNRIRVAREEIFGPVVVIIPFDDEREAIEIANDSLYGLAAGIWCEDPERARGAAMRLRAGRVRINGAPLNKRCPHGGFKQSGIGREWGRFGIEGFLEYQSVVG
jgi:aldehyde dehydrogenase (NAD+)